MREKELRLALICYGGISLAVYMHGITKEIWHLARASEAFHGGREGTGASEAVYVELLRRAAEESGVSVRVLVDILAGASAGGINAIFLAEAISHGHSLDPLTDLWLDAADVDILIDPSVSRVSRFAKAAAVPMKTRPIEVRSSALPQRPPSTPRASRRPRTTISGSSKAAGAPYRLNNRSEA